MEPQPALADALNELSLGASVVDPAWSVADAGFGSEGIVETLRGELATKFPGFNPEYLPQAISPDALFAYGYLSKNLKFRTAFAAREGRFGDSTVRTFGLGGNPFGDDPARIAQVVVHDWIAPKDFVLELIAEDPDSHLVVAQIPPEETLAATAAKAMSRLGTFLGEARRLARDEVLSIPRLALDVEGSFVDLVGRPMLTEQIRGKCFDVAKQRVKFHMNEGGAGIKSEAIVTGYGPPPPRSFQVSQPFLVLMIRRGASSPYLAAWIESTAWMVVLGRAEPAVPEGFYDPAGFGPSPGFGPPRGP
jgi:hypothetical protein